MRRKSERTATKKTKPSPEKKEKIDKSKRTRAKRRKQSSSSDNESVEEIPPTQVAEVSKAETEPPPQPVKEDSPEESQDQVWQVKATESSGDVGEIQKLKICLTRPPSTPERVDRSPRSKRKHSRATSSSDTPSVDGDERKKTKHRSKRSTTDSKEDEKNVDSQSEDLEVEVQSKTETTPSKTDVIPTKTDSSSPSKPELTSSTQSDSSQSKTESEAKTNTEVAASDDTPMSTTNEETKSGETDTKSASEQAPSKAQSEEDKEKSETVKEVVAGDQEKSSDADTTVASPKPESNEEKEGQSSDHSPLTRNRSMSVEKSEILELHAEESRCESSETGLNDTQESITELESHSTDKVSISAKKSEISGKSESAQENKIDTNKTDVVESSQSSEVEKSIVEESNPENNDVGQSKDKLKAEAQSTNKVHNGQSAPLVINRKRRWGSRPNKLATQKSITISTDVLKEIIPDVKPVEFDEVVEERKHKRVEVPERFDRPVLPKIVIDNTESIEVKKESEGKDKENIKVKDKHMSSSRKISIVKDNDSIIARPPSPPRHKQSNILYITNLVRPFTLPQLKNLLQRTGKIVEDGFWIDRIKSKCYVKYEKEDQAVETRHALHGVTWPVSNPKTLHVDFSTQEDFDNAKVNQENDIAQKPTIPGTVEDWLREQDMKRERGELDKPWERKTITREWDVGKNEKDKEVIRPEKIQREERLDKRRHRSPERSPEPARKFKKKEEEAPAKLLDDLFRKTKTTPCIYWLPLSAETIAIKEEQRRQHMAEHERRLQELRRTHRRH